jgi:hypothetical protein
MHIRTKQSDTANTIKAVHDLMPYSLQSVAPIEHRRVSDVSGVHKNQIHERELELLRGPAAFNRRLTPRNRGRVRRVKVRMVYLERFRVRAEECEAKANTAPDPDLGLLFRELAAQWRQLAVQWLKLARQREELHDVQRRLTSGELGARRLVRQGTAHRREETGASEMSCD